jgi:uncharacterized protein YlxW (UPF0749 family)
MPERDDRQDAPAEEAVDGRTRLVASLRRPNGRGQLVAGVLLAALGFAAVTQVRSNGRDDDYVGARQGDLIQYINTLSLASRRAETEIAELQRTREALGSDTEARRTALTLARRQADTLGILAGTVPAVGPGIRATVTGGSSVGSDQLLNGLQELRDAGAEVIELNGRVRVVAQTSLQDAPDGTVVDGTLLEPPYVIEAIGDPHDLAVALGFAGGFTSEVQDAGGKVEVSERDKVDISSVRKPKPPVYAQPDSSG